MADNIRQIEVTLTTPGKLAGSCRNNQPITVDYANPLVDGHGYTPMELLLTSLASCSGATVISILQKKRKQVDAFKVNARGIKRAEPPGAFEQIYLDFTLQSPDATPTDLERSIQLAEEKHCPVWAMLKGNVAITTNSTINAQ